MLQLSGSIYDHPQYYDLIFGSDCDAEMDFLFESFQVFAEREVKHLFEPACGTGRLMVRFAHQGYDVSGIDLNSKAIDFCNDRLVENGFAGSAFVGDMCDFKIDTPADAAFNTINSFRHLETNAQAHNHLAAMADAIAPGGLYVLGLHLSPEAGAMVEEESWSASEGPLQVDTHMWLIHRDLPNRFETYGMKYEVHEPGGRAILEDKFNFRTYTFKEILELVESEPRWEVAEVFDFAYDILQPVELDEESEDVVLILRRKA